MGMADKEEIVDIFSELRNFADNDVHPVVSPKNWHIYSKLRDLIDRAEADVLAMLKEHEPIKPIKVDEIYYCGKCRKGPIGFLGNEHNGDKFCRNCGQAVKWDV